MLQLIKFGLNNYKLIVNILRKLRLKKVLGNRWKIHGQLHGVIVVRY